jgi:hypothetical protein
VKACSSPVRNASKPAAAQKIQAVDRRNRSSVSPTRRRWKRRDSSESTRKALACARESKSPPMTMFSKAPTAGKNLNNLA